MLQLWIRADLRGWQVVERVGVVAGTSLALRRLEVSMAENDWTSKSATQWAGDSLTERASEAKDVVAGMARGAMDSVNAGRSGAAKGLDALATGLQDHADVLPGGESVRDFARATADQVTETAEYVRGADLRAMMTDVKGVVRKNPGPALLIAAGLGFVVGRALRS